MDFYFTPNYFHQIFVFNVPHILTDTHIPMYRLKLNRKLGGEYIGYMGARGRSELVLTKFCSRPHCFQEKSNSS